MTTPGGFKAGFARRDIGPKEPCFLAGYPHVERAWERIHDPLFASALCVENEGEAAMILSLDWLFVTAEWTRDCRERISRATGIPASRIMVGATHTHSGPLTAEILAWRDDPVVPRVDPAYMEFACAETAAAATDAWNGRESAEAVWTEAFVGGIAGGNRIDPEGAEDPEAGVLLVRRAAGGKALAALVVYGMHPTVLHEDSRQVSGDFIACARNAIEGAFPGIGVVYLNGVCGNQSPRRAVRANTFPEAERVGKALGNRIVEAFEKAGEFRGDFAVKAASERIRVCGKKFPDIAWAAENLDAARQRHSELCGGGASTADVRTAECTVFGAEEVLALAKAEQDGSAEALRRRYAEAEVQVFRIGPVSIAGWPGEFFVEYGLEAKRRAAQKLFVATMCNGEMQGYVVTPEAESSGGYEAQMSLFPASAGKAFVEATLSIAGKL